MTAVLWAPAAAASPFGGFGGREDAYLVGRDRICQPIAVKNGVAAGMPACRAATTSEVAALSVKSPHQQSGPRAYFAATARGRELVVSRRDNGAVLVTWTSLDSISEVTGLYGSTYNRLVAVEITIRRAGRAVTEVVAFDLREAGAVAPSTPPEATPPVTPPVTPPPGAPTAAAAPVDARLQQLVAVAQKANGKRVLAAWRAVLARDAEHAEALFKLALAQAQAKQRESALSSLEQLAKSPRPDAIEWRVEARFTKAFASIRGEPRFRAAVGLDQPATSLYERLMGFGGAWEQAGTSCDTPEVSLKLGRDRRFTLQVRTRCEGMRAESRYKGTWQDQGDQLVLVLPNPGGKDEGIACTLARQGDEDAIQCTLDEDVQFKVLPVRR